MAALHRFAAAGAAERKDFLAVATPGAGKTTFALTAALQDLAASRRRVVVVAPTQHLKRHWAHAAAVFGLHLDPEWSAADGRLPPDMHGIVTTYQQVSTSASALAKVAAGAFVVFDEIHHAGDERAWGLSVREAFDGAGRRLSLSGTPFRSDTHAIPFVEYVYDEAVPDYEYGYGDALEDGGVVRPVYFPRINGHMEWTAPDGTFRSATFEDDLDSVTASQRLRTALSLKGEWLPSVLDQAHAQLIELRRSEPAAGGLAIAMDQEHARGIAALLRRRFGVVPTVALSDDPEASSHISRFATSEAPWIVAVRMVAEGVDIPRLRVGVFATNTTTELFFRQAVGRLVRWTRPPASGALPATATIHQRAFMFIPDDGRLRSRAAQIAQVRRHSLHKRARRDGAEPEGWCDSEAAIGLDGFAEDGQAEQLSLFEVISAVALETVGAAVDPWSDGLPDGWTLPSDAVVEGEDEAEELLVTLAPPPPLAGGLEMPASGMTRRQHKSAMRDANANLARDLAHRTGMTHAQVNAELNRLTGIQRITEATVEQLEKRLHHAEAWWARSRT